jgi:catechol 2,3-dioxygenase-like lactoylglutathione lyase family enzyme
MLLSKVDAVTMRVPNLDDGVAFYVGQLGHRVLWRNDGVGQVALALPDSDTELVLSTRLDSEPNWLVDDVPAAVDKFCAAGGEVVSSPADIPVGRVAVVRDPFGNSLVLVDLSSGRYDSADAALQT